MALILFAAAAAENDRIEKEKNQVRWLEKYLGKKIPNFLVEWYYYTYTVSDEIKKLYVSIEHMNESEKAVAVKGVLQILISKYEKQQKDRYEEERGWDSRLTKAPRTIRWSDFSYKVKLLNGESAKELQKLFLNNWVHLYRG